MNFRQKKWSAFLVPVLLLGACAIRFDWPRHDIRINFRAAGDASPWAPLKLAVSSVKLMPCETQTRGYVLLFSLIPSAHAHGIGSETALAIPVIVSGETDIRVGSLEPPPYRYCAIKINFGPADDDALDDPKNEMVGWSLVWNGASPGKSASRADITLELEPPLVLVDFRDQVVDMDIRVDLSRLDNTQAPLPDAIWSDLPKAFSLSLSEVQ